MVLINGSKSKVKTEIVTKEKYHSFDQCKCGGPIFKYHDTTKNIFVGKCGYFSKVLDIEKETKKKIWIPSKKPACDWICVYHGPRPVFNEINNTLNKFVERNITDPHKQLENKLKLLFKFLYLSNHTSTLDEINLLVKNNLYREPRKTFYFPSIGHFMRVSHYEPFDEYEKRIFSKKIIDVSSILYEKYLAQKAEQERKDIEVEIKRKKKEAAIQRKKEADLLLEEVVSSQFIIVESDTDAESGSDDEYDSDNDDLIKKEDESEYNDESEYEDKDSPDEETEEVYEEEYYEDEYDDVEVDYYDD